MNLTSDQLDEINRIYDEKRLAAAHLKQDRLNEVIRRVPAFKEISDSIVELSVSRARRSLTGDKNALEDLSARIGELSSKKLSLLRATGYPDGYLDDVYSCNKCKDTGYVDNKRCTCFVELSVSMLYNQSNIRDILNDVDFSLFSGEYYQGEDLIHFNDSLSKAKSFVDSFDDEFGNLIFYGTVGTGKSLMTQCIAKALIESGHSVLYYSATTLMNAISMNTFDYSHSHEESHNELYNCDLLIIDDLGTEIHNNFTVSSLFSLLNERSNRNKSVIISTNLPYEELLNRYTDRIFSRITGNYTFCRMSGPDIRILNKQRRSNQS